MLNYIWLSLVVIGVGVAVWSDARDLSANTYHNGRAVAVAIEYRDGPDSPGGSPAAAPCTVIVTPADFNSAYGASLKDTVRQKAEYFAGVTGEGGPDDRPARPPAGRGAPRGGVLHIFV